MPGEESREPPGTTETQEVRRRRQERLVRECAKLRLEEEKVAAEEVFVGEAEWPAY